MSDAKIEKEKVIGPAKLTVRKLFLKKAGDSHQGHKHKIHHITALVKGEVEVYIGDNEPYKAVAPLDIFIDKDVPHKFIALTDDVEYWCIFATNSSELTQNIFCEIGQCSGCVASSG